MGRKKIDENIKRRLYAESMGRCMNPKCQKELFVGDGDIAEKAHIIAYCDTEDNSFENLLILCPNCHEKFDKTSSFSPEEVKRWKHIRKEELNKLFSQKFTTFDELRREVLPLLSENKIIYENYYLSNKKQLWDKFEIKILVNNRKLKKIFEHNWDLFQRHTEKRYSNLECIYSFIAHAEEFESTRVDKEKVRKILFPAKINSIFGISPIMESMLPSTESLEDLITKLNERGEFETIVMGIENPYIKLIEDGESRKVFLCDTPRLRQLYFNYSCFARTKVRLGSLNFALKYMNSNNMAFEFIVFNNLREVDAYGTKIIFVYEYCLSKVDLMNLSPSENSVIVNLHNWNGECCISNEAYSLSKEIHVTLLTMEKFYVYVKKIKSEKYNL